MGRKNSARAGAKVVGGGAAAKPVEPLPLRVNRSTPLSRVVEEITPGKVAGPPVGAHQQVAGHGAQYRGLVRLAFRQAIDL